MQPLTGDQLATWLEIQEKLISNVYHIPIYFAHKGEVETSVLNDIIAQDMNRGASTDESRLVVMTSEPKALRNFNMVNIMARPILFLLWIHNKRSTVGLAYGRIKRLI